MAKVALTDLAVKAIKSGKHPVEKYDGVVPGFGVRVMPSGSKSWIFVYSAQRGPKKVRARYVIGPVKVRPDDGGLDLRAARAEAIGLRVEVDAGKDPALLKRLKRDEHSKRAVSTFGHWLDEYKRLHLSKRKRGKDVEAVLGRRLAHWHDIPMTELSKLDVIAAIEMVRDEGHVAAPRQLFDYARGMFNWAIKEQGLEMSSPFWSIKAPPKPPPRDRVLNENEIRRIWTACGELGYPFGSVIRFLLVTGQRLDEVASMTWDEVDFDSKLWMIPKERVKSSRVNHVPLSELAVSILEGMPRYRKGKHIFSTTGGLRPVSGFSRAKERIDAAIAAAESVMPNWTFHALRHTCRTRLSWLRVSDTVAELTINHARKGLQATYDHHTFAGAKRRALVAWSRLISLIIEPSVWEKASPPEDPISDDEQVRSDEFYKAIHGSQEAWQKYIDACTSDNPADNVFVIREVI